MVFRVILRLAYAICILLETLLIVRFILKLFNANSSHIFVRWLYSITSSYLEPISGIFASSIIIFGFTIEITSVLGMIILTIIAYAILEIMKVFQ